MADNMTPEPTAAGMPVANPRSYLGHFAHNAVMEQGHNVGHKRIGAAVPVPSVAKRGYTKLPGTAVNQQGHARYGEAPTGLPPTRAERIAQAKAMKAIKAQMPMMHAPVLNGDTPHTAMGAKLSIKHHLDDAARDRRHSMEHNASEKKHKAIASSLKRGLKRK